MQLAVGSAPNGPGPICSTEQSMVCMGESLAMLVVVGHWAWPLACNHTRALRATLTEPCLAHAATQKQAHNTFPATRSGRAGEAEVRDGERDNSTTDYLRVRALPCLTSRYASHLQQAETGDDGHRRPDVVAHGPQRSHARSIPTQPPSVTAAAAATRRVGDSPRPLTPVRVKKPAATCYDGG